VILEQRINTKLYVKLEKNASDTCAVLSEAYGEKLGKSRVFLSGIIGSKKARMSKSQRQCLSLSSVLTVLFSLNSFYEAKQSTKLITWKY